MSSTAFLVGSKHGVEPAQHGHRQDDVAVLPADVEVAQHIVGDAKMKLTMLLWMAWSMGFGGVPCTDRL